MKENMRDFSILKQRILQYLDFKGITKYECYKNTGITNGVLSQPNGMSEDNLLKFLSYYSDISTEKRKMIAETFGISLANLSQILRFKRNGKNAEAIRKMAQENGGIKYTEGNEPSKVKVLDSHGNVTRVISNK